MRMKDSWQQGAAAAPSGIEPLGGRREFMRIAIIGQQKFGKAVLEAFSDRGDTVAGVFCAPEKPGSPPDPLRLAAEERGIRLFQLSSLKAPEAIGALRDLGVDI